MKCKREAIGQRGFTLVELLIVVAVIGLIAAIAIPNLLNAIERARQKRAMGEVRAIATAAISYYTDTDKYPMGDGTFHLTGPYLTSQLCPDYIRAIPEKDPWNSGYGYAADSMGKNFGVVCTCKDHMLESTSEFANTLHASIMQTNCFENDVVWIDDTFIKQPGGKQKKCV